MSRLKKFLKALGIAVKDEVKEISTLQPTDEDYKQGAILAAAAVAAMTSMGCAPALLSTDILTKVFAYGIRDIKDGAKVNDKLIAFRVINELRKAGGTASDI